MYPALTSAAYHHPPMAIHPSQVYHPNIDQEGKICLNILRKRVASPGWLAAGAYATAASPGVVVVVLVVVVLVVAADADADAPHLSQTAKLACLPACLAPSPRPIGSHDL